MKKIKFSLILFALAVFIAGVFVSFGAANAYADEPLKPWNVSAVITYQNDSFDYDLEREIANATDEANERGFYLGYNGRRALCDYLLATGAERAAVYEYLLPGFTKIVEHFAYINKQKIDCEVNFSKKGFAYSAPQNGIETDIDKLFECMIKICGKRVKISLPYTVDKALTIEQAKQNTVKKASFTTTFYNSGDNRAHNISLAAESLNGITVSPNEEFSFNKIVGERSEKNGYKNAKVILDGSYTDGVGGGVCQVSTTLYNALLLAGFIPKASQHSLVSSYVMAGFDAMVAYGSTDLTFVNNTEHNLYIQGKTQGKTVTFTIYGEPNEYEIKRENVEERQPFGVVEIVDKVKYPDLIYDDQMLIVTNGSDGVKTKSYLKYYKDGRLVASRLIRSNNYKRVDKVIARGNLPRPEQNDGAMAGLPT